MDSRTKLLIVDDKPENLRALHAIIRSDDREEVIRERLQTYDVQTRPVAEYYEQKGRLVPLNGDLEVGEVTGQMFWVIEHRDGNCL